MKKSVVVTNIVMSRFRLRGEQVKNWALARGYKPDTVYKTIYGTRGKAHRGESLDIKEALALDGYWPSEKEISEASRVLADASNG